jgi:hypothetical protein
MADAKANDIQRKCRDVGNNAAEKYAATRTNGYRGQAIVRC